MTDHIIGIDIANRNSQDYSALAMLCKNCKTIIHIEIFEGEQPTLKTPNRCSNCGIVFKKGITIK